MLRALVRFWKGVLSTSPTSIPEEAFGRLCRSIVCAATTLAGVETSVFDMMAELMGMVARASAVDAFVFFR